MLLSLLIAPVLAPALLASGAAQAAATHSSSGMVSLTGSWLPGGGPDDPPGPTDWTPPCGDAIVPYTVKQEGRTVTWSMMSVDAPRGGAYRPTITTWERVKGRFEEGVLRLSGELGTDGGGGDPDAAPRTRKQPVHYELSLDPKNGELSGTRNGQSFRARRVRVIQPDCPPIPWNIP